jgi:hypothetical protein
MVSLARDLVLTATFLAIIFLAAHRNPPSRMVETPYCVVDKRVAVKDLLGNWNFSWGKAFAPCSQQDRFVDA